MHGNVAEAFRALLKANARYDSSRYEEKNEKAHKKKAWSMRKKDLYTLTRAHLCLCLLPRRYRQCGWNARRSFRGDLSTGLH